MTTPNPVMPPQINTISLAEGMNRTNYWRQAVKQFYGNDTDRSPHGFFIALTDVLELAKIATYFPEYTFVGVRAYLTFHHPQPNANGQFSDAVTAVLVPVYEVLVEDERTGELVGQYLDFIQPVPTDTGVFIPGTYTIYDVTQPCPTQCDPGSPLQ